MTRWTIDPVHSEINFKVKHLVVSTVSGTFRKFSASIDASADDFAGAEITFEAEVNSIDTKNEQRDNHLKSADFFDAAQYPKISFVSKNVKRLSDHELEVVGNMTMHGTTKEITLRAVYNGTVAGFGGSKVAGFEIAGKLHRFDFGLQWNALTEAGGVVVGNEINVEILAEFNVAKQQSLAA